MNNPAVTRYLEARHRRHTMDDLRLYVATMPLCGIFVDNTHVGNIKMEVDVRHNRGDIGLLIGPEHWGKGYATKAITMITRYAWDVRLHKVTAGAYAENVGSIRAFERAGFKQEGLLKDHWLVDGEYQDGILLGKVNES